MPTGTLSGSGKSLWESVYKDSKKKGDDEQTAAQKAWGAIKAAGWRKIKGKWVKKSEIVETFSMYISKASLDGKVMRWQATNSDTDPDSHDEQMSLELYQSFIENILNKVDVPEVFRSAVYSDYWHGGMPYLSISHYPDLGGKAVPGQVGKLYIDGNKLKAKGNLYNTPLGHAVYRSLKLDENKSPQDKIRISIGFLDLAHRHGNGKVWVRESLYSVCPECSAGVGDKVYIKGYLVHLALTRVPVNKRTEMVLEEKSDMTKKITRKEDAASIVGKDEAEVIDALNKASTVVKSDTLVEMSEGEEPTTEETQELVAEAEGSTEPSEPVVDNGAVADEEGLTENEEATEAEVVLDSEVELFEIEKADSRGGYLVSDRGDGQPALPTKKNGKLDHGLMGAAWAALHGGYRGNKYEGKGKQEAISKLTKLYKKENLPVPSEKSETGEVELSDMGMSSNMPYGGATSMKDAKKHKDTMQEMVDVMDMFSMFNNVVWNILDSGTSNPKEAIKGCVDELKSMLAAKAMVEFSQTIQTPAQTPVVERSESDHPLKPALDALISAVDNSIVLEGDINTKLASVNQPLQDLGIAITDFVQKSVKEPAAPKQNENNLLDNIRTLIQLLVDDVASMKSEFGIMKAQMNTQNVQPQAPRIPTPRTARVQSNLTQKSQATKSPTPKLHDLINKSVGIVE